MLVGPHLINLSLLWYLPFALKVHVFAFSAFPKGSHRIPSKVHFCKRRKLQSDQQNKSTTLGNRLTQRTRFPTRIDGRRRTVHGGPGAGAAAPLHPGLLESLERSWRTRPTPAERGSGACPGAAETAAPLPRPFRGPRALPAPAALVPCS